MADLDFIDSIVDQCLGAGGNGAASYQSAPAPPPPLSQAHQQEPPQRPASARAYPSEQQRQAPNAMPSPPPSAPTQQQQSPTKGYQPPKFQPQHQQQQAPSVSHPMPSPVPRDAYYDAASMPNRYQQHPSLSSSANYLNQPAYAYAPSNTNQRGDEQNAAPAASYTTDRGPSPGPHSNSANVYTSGGGRPHEYQPNVAQGEEYSSALNGNTNRNTTVGGDAALRRIQMWDEKKRLKQTIARRELENRGNEECTFRPNIQAARDSVLATKLGLNGTSAQKGRGGGTIGFGYGGGNSGLTIGSRLPPGANVVTSPKDADPHQRSLTSLSTVSQAIMTPSRLYKDNKAWGYDSFIDRQTYAREMKRQQEEDAAAIFALKNPDRPLRVTVPEPFEFGNKGRKAVKKNLEPPSASIVQRVKREQNDFFAEDSSSYDLHHSTSGAYFTHDGDADHHYNSSRQYRATDALTAPSVPAGLFSLHASNMMLEYAPQSTSGLLSTNQSGPYSPSSARTAGH